MERLRLTKPGAGESGRELGTVRQGKEVVFCLFLKGRVVSRGRGMRYFYWLDIVQDE